MVAHRARRRVTARLAKNLVCDVVTFEALVSSNRCGYTARVSHSSPAFLFFYASSCVRALLTTVRPGARGDTRAAGLGADAAGGVVAVGNSRRGSGRSLSVPPCSQSMTRGA